MWLNISINIPSRRPLSLSPSASSVSPSFLSPFSTHRSNHRSPKTKKKPQRSKQIGRRKVSHTDLDIDVLCGLLLLVENLTLPITKWSSAPQGGGLPRHRHRRSGEARKRSERGPHRHL